MAETSRGDMPILEYGWRLFLCLVYIVSSTSLIRFNKYLMHRERFPHALALTAMHMAGASVLSGILYLVRPSLYPGMQTAAGQRLLVLKWFVPIGACFAVTLYAANQAYLHCNVAFLQFMKECNLILIFLMSCAVGLQVLNRVRLAVIVWVLAGSSLAISGEMHFVWMGFALQAVSQLAECTKAVMGELVLRGGGLKLDPLSYTMFAAPICLVVLLIANVLMWDPAVPAQVAQWWPYLLPNVLLAFCLNVAVAFVIKEVSAVGFILAGCCKDIFIVLFSSLVAGEIVTGMQYVAFGVTLAGIFFWSYMQVCPDSPSAIFAETLVGMPSRKAKAPDEATALLA